MKEQAIRTIRTLLPSSGTVTIGEIEEAVNQALSLPVYGVLDREELIRELHATYSIHVDNFRIIEAAERRRPWISDRRGSINWNFWNRYRDFLLYEKNFASSVVSQLDRLTDRTLDGLLDPKASGVLSKYGLVVGQVQSGKTANYTGLVCKAADAGYRLIIVLAGTLNNLRTQTQLRLDEGFLGFDTEHERAFRTNNRFIGVGRLNQVAIAHSLTSGTSDFKAPVANAIGINFGTNETIIAVVKKNAGVLRRLHTWLAANGVEAEDGQKIIRNKSLLLIDDEADHASINTNRDGETASSINHHIRRILGLFERSGYVGYTATPFANIFIPVDDQDQLFPRDFIINLPPPSNYVGPDKVFGFEFQDDSGEASLNTLPIIHRIDDFSQFVPARHRKADPLPVNAPESLQRAIRCFILTCAIRRLRGQIGVHNSMLVHVTRFVRWQQHIKEQIVQPVVDFYRRGIEFETPEVMVDMRNTLELDEEGYRSYHTTSQQILDSDLRDIDPSIEVHSWDEVMPFLHEAASRIEVKEINGGSADALNYFDHTGGLSVIAIGGDKLSRGLTLEGLSVSYYLRASRMYDTLMQMGRWFGYRPGYVDLCRLFTSRELNEWFCHITLASEELRSEFDYMSDIIGTTPEHYALRVRTHPGVLQISASNKIRNVTEVNVSWSGRLIESYELSKRPEVIATNLAAAAAFVRDLGEPIECDTKRYLWRDVPWSHVRDFLARFQVWESLRSAAPGNLIRFIDFKNSHRQLTRWNVALITKLGGRTYELGSGIRPALIKRTQTESSEGQEYYYIRKSHILSPNDEFVDLTADERSEAMRQTRLIWANREKEGSPKYPSGEWVRNNLRKQKDQPLLLLYLLDPTGADLDQDSSPIVGFGISFPGSDANDAVSYAVHEQLLSLFSQDDDYFDMETEEDDSD